MTKETTNTGFEILPKAHYILEIDKVIKTQIGREGGKQYPGYKWFFTVRQCNVDLDSNNFNLFMFKSKMGDLLRALGVEEVSQDVFTWDTDDVKGKVIECDLIHEDINGRLREGLIEIKPYSVNVKDPNQKPNEEVAWDEGL